MVGENYMCFSRPRETRTTADALIRRDQEQQARARLRTLIADGLASGAGRTVTDDVIAELRAQAFDGEA
jgi:hypothetical protein